MTPETIAELRRLLDEVRDGSPLPWRRIGSRVDAADRFKVAECLLDEDAALIVAAVNALPALLDAAGRLAEVEAERDALAAKVERVTGEAADMRARLSRAARALDDDKLAEVGEARARLHGKAQGVRLALDYFRGTALDGRAADR